MPPLILVHGHLSRVAGVAGIIAPLTQAPRNPLIREGGNYLGLDSNAPNSLHILLVDNFVNCYSLRNFHTADIYCQSMYFPLKCQIFSLSEDLL